MVHSIFIFCVSSLHILCIHLILDSFWISLFFASQYCPSRVMFLYSQWRFFLIKSTEEHSGQTEALIISFRFYSSVHGVILNGLVSNVFLVLNSNWSFSPWTLGIRGWWKKSFRKNTCTGMFWSENGKHRVLPDVTSWYKLKVQSLRVGSVLFISTETSLPENGSLIFCGVCCQ